MLLKICSYLENSLRGHNGMDVHCDVLLLDGNDVEREIVYKDDALRC